MNIVAIANQKGGVGKTSTCVNLAAGLGIAGKNVLLVDMDPQGNCTSGLGIERKQVETSIYDLLVDEAKLEDCVMDTTWLNVSLVPATIDLAGAEIELVAAMSRETRLKRALIDAPYDTILIDCPPSLGLLTLNSFVAANSLIIPIQCEYYALEGLSQLMNTINLVRSHLNADLKLDGLVLTMFDSRTRLSKDVADEVKTRFGAEVFNSVIPRNVRISEAPSHGMPIQYYDGASLGSLAYQKLTREVLKRWQSNAA